MRYRTPNLRMILAVQVVAVCVIATALTAGPRWSDTHALPRIPIARRAALQIAPLYDDPSVVSDADLEMVLRRVRPLFPRERLKPNHVEHALRTWGVKATFRDPRALSGAEMLDFLTNNGEYLKSWHGDVPPLLVPQADGVAVRWGREQCASVHHDHLLACLSEAGVRLDTPIHPPGGKAGTFNDLLQHAIRNFRVDQWEPEWSAMAFALWLPPRTPGRGRIRENSGGEQAHGRILTNSATETTSWRTTDGRLVDFDLIARRLMRGDAGFGVCSGTHRVYSLVLLYRINEESRILSEPMRKAVRNHLLRMRDLIVAAQFPDGHWASNWSQGSESRQRPVTEPDYKAVIATGHHLEWLAIAPPEFHPPRESVRKAARWLVENVKQQTDAAMLERYTFYSHVGNALALWRGTRPAEFWASHRQ